MPTAPAAASLQPAEDLLEAAVTEVERGLAALAQSLVEPDGGAIDRAAGALQQSLARALDALGRAARRGALTPALRRRLVQASAQVAAQRDKLARASAALDRAIEVLMPREAAGYTASGSASLQVHSGRARA